MAVGAEGTAFKVDDVVAQQKQIRADMLAGKSHYAAMPESKRDELVRKQDHLFAVLDGKQSSSDLSPDQYADAFNTLEWIEGTINNDDANRMICRREKTLGSNRTARVCRTVAQMELERERARVDMDQSNNRQLRGN
ncbi:MAG: hypothetical protein ABJA62_08745 [Luteimonas sp.]